MKIVLMLIHYCGLDINECNTSNGGCNQTCVNEVGSYHCECRIGYTLNSNNHSCDGKVTTITRCLSLFLLYIDNNECSTNNGGCEHNCINTPGSYSCSCNTGYSLDLDNRGCSRKKSYYIHWVLLYIIV